MTEIGHKDENKWPEGCAGTKAFFLPSKEVAQGILGFKSAWRDGDSQSKATPSASCARDAAHLSKAARVTGTVNILTPCQEVCYSPLPHASDELPGPSHASPHSFAPSLPLFLPPSLRHFLNTSLTWTAETGDTACDEMENTCPIRSTTASMQKDKQKANR